MSNLGEPKATAGEPTPLTDAERKHLRNEFAHLIDVISNRIHYAETRRSTYAVLGGALTASGLAVIPFIWKSEFAPAWTWGGIALGLSAIALGAAIWFLYAAQTNYAYPFKGAAPTWKWFYRDALESNSGPKTRWLDYLHVRSKDSERIAEHYTSRREAFRAKLWTLRDEDLSLSQDLDQIYILHINDKYKNEFLTHLRKLFSWGLLVMLAVTMIGFWVGAHLAPTAVGASHTRVGSLDVSAKWEPTGNTRSLVFGSEEAQLLVNLTIMSSVPTSVRLETLRFKTADGTVIPSFIQGPTRSCVALGSSGKVEHAVLVWVEKRLASRIHLVSLSD